jgi:hypothetical protein
LEGSHLQSSDKSRFQYFMVALQSNYTTPMPIASKREDLHKGRITFEQLPWFKLGYNLGFHVHLITVFQWQKWFGHLSSFNDEGSMAEVCRNLKNMVGGRLWEDQPQSALRF